jgi:hypothetical protein
MTRSLRIGISSSLLLAALLLAAPPALHADDVCGVVFTGNDVAVAAGADWVRTPLYWGVVEPSQGQFNFSSLDGVLRATAQNGAPRMKNTLTGIEGFAGYLNTGGGYQAPCGAAWSDMLTHWQNLWRVATARYCASNPTDNPGQTHGVVRYWSVWNEPNAPGFLYPRATCGSPSSAQYCASNPAACTTSAAQDYADLVAAAEAGRQQGCPSDAKLVVGEVAQGPNASTFTQSVVQNLAGRVAPPVLSYHSYTFAIGARQDMQTLRGILNSAGLSQTELWMTEAGGPDSCHDQNRAYDGTCFAKREVFLRSIIAENRQYGTALNWKRTFIFRSAPLTADYGLVNVDGAGAPIGSNMAFDALKAACNSPLDFPVLSGYNDGQDLKNSCYAMATNNSAYCNNIALGNDKQMCLAMAQRSQSPCTSITDRNLQLACYGMSIKWDSNCRDITNGNMNNFCYGVSTPNTASCNSITEANTRSLCLAMASGSTSYCGSIPYVNDRNFCYGVASRNTSYCDGINYYADSVQR